MNLNREFTLEQYIKLSERFNKMSFEYKLKTIKNNQDLITLASDYDWFEVKVVDEEIQEQLEQLEREFIITKVWGIKEMYALLELLEIKNTSL